MNQSHFLELTDPTLLPFVDASVAMRSVELETQLVKDLDPSELSSLQNRCVEALSKDWEALITHNDLASQSSTFAALLSKSLTRAKEEKTDLLKQKTDTDEVAFPRRRPRLNVWRRANFRNDPVLEEV